MTVHIEVDEKEQTIKSNSYKMALVSYTVTIHDYSQRYSDYKTTYNAFYDYMQIVLKS